MLIMSNRMIPLVPWQNSEASQCESVKIKLSD